MAALRFSCFFVLYDIYLITTYYVVSLLCVHANVACHIMVTHVYYGSYFFVVVTQFVWLFEDAFSVAAVRPQRRFDGNRLSYSQTKD